MSASAASPIRVRERLAATTAMASPARKSATPPEPAPSPSLPATARAKRKAAGILAYKRMALAGLATNWAIAKPNRLIVPALASSAAHRVFRATRSQTEPVAQQAPAPPARACTAVFKGTATPVGAACRPNRAAPPKHAARATHRAKTANTVATVSAEPVRRSERIVIPTCAQPWTSPAARAFAHKTTTVVTPTAACARQLAWRANRWGAIRPPPGCRVATTSVRRA